MPKMCSMSTMAGLELQRVPTLSKLSFCSALSLEPLFRAKPHRVSLGTHTAHSPDFFDQRDSEKFLCRDFCLLPAPLVLLPPLLNPDLQIPAASAASNMDFCPFSAGLLLCLGSTAAGRLYTGRKPAQTRSSSCLLPFSQGSESMLPIFPMPENNGFWFIYLFMY